MRVVAGGAHGVDAGALIGSPLGGLLSGAGGQVLANLGQSLLYTNGDLTAATVGYAISGVLLLMTVLASGE